MEDPKPLVTSFANQNARAKIRLELPEGVLIEVPLCVIVRAIQEQYMPMQDGKRKKTAHWAFPDFYADDDDVKALVHFVVTTEEGYTIPKFV